MPPHQMKYPGQFFYSPVLLFATEVEKSGTRNEDVSVHGSWCEETRAGVAVIGAVY